MPNRYEREIEEILRNLEHTDPKQGTGQKFGERLRRRSSPRSRMPIRQRSLFSFQFSLTERLLIIAVVAALVAGGYAYAQGQPDIFSAIVACIGVVCLLGVALSHFLFRPRPTQSIRYGNVTVTPLRRNPFSSIKTQWNLFMLKLRYRRKDRH